MTSRAQGAAAGENSIIIVGGANTQDWDFTDDANQARPAVLYMTRVCSTLMMAMSMLCTQNIHACRRPWAVLEQCCYNERYQSM